MEHLSFYASLLPLLLQGAFVTLKISLASILAGLALGVPMALFSSRFWTWKALRIAIKAYVTLFRGTPLFVQLLIIYFALPDLLGINFSALQAGVLALSLNSAAYLTETLRGGINALPSEQWEAAAVLGYSPWQNMRWIILPQALSNSLAALTNEFISLIKESSILMIVGVRELTKMSKEMVAHELRPLEIYLLTACIYLLMTSSLAWLTKRWEGNQNAH